MFKEKEKEKEKEKRFQANFITKTVHCKSETFFFIVDVLFISQQPFNVKSEPLCWSVLYIIKSNLNVIFSTKASGCINEYRNADSFRMRLSIEDGL